MKQLLLISTICFCAPHVFSQVHFKEITVECMNLTRLPGNSVISDQREYERLYDYRSPHPNCSSYTLPEIDFQKEMLININADASGCSEPKIKFEIQKKEEGCEVDVTVEPDGLCKMLFQKQIWIVVSKSDCSKIIFR